MKHRAPCIRKYSQVCSPSPHNHFSINKYHFLGIKFASQLHLFPAKYRQSARISVIMHRLRQYGIEHLLLDTAHEVRYSAA